METITTPVAVVETPVAVETAPVVVETVVAETTPVKAKAPKAKGKKVKKAVKEVKPGRGRPVVYTGPLEKAIVKVIREHGLTYGRVFLAETGVQVAPGKPKQKVDVSMPTLGKLAARNKVKLFRGRPKIAA